ncbi:MAG: MgtC/SapB family protein [Limnochordaceae bacterium]|uniref:MgtC/SapB family protein n=1 Tax=Carboxydichorda subterranea TaxID=3109565 RepID=A0ABZ1C337_9FIRM|nr:MgtC/SapB family protein [Limnochorda sp. L945t]MBE3597945.1 MgtC/SapB family protein [Limnochordaceae bacterium]WRP18523.1 MgtC/SapB family protein [Limnochorda sp. L945t]
MGISDIELVIRLVLAGLLGAIIGLERESHRRPAGFRTHTLVSLGSALVMLVSAYGLAPQGSSFWPYDPTRIAAQVVSGIGFLGAGTILREGPTVRGLTTAASLWVVAGIGLAAGSGFYLGAVMTTALAVVVLIWLSRVERQILSSKESVLALVVSDQPGQLGAVASVLGRHGVNIRGVDIVAQEGAKAALQVTVELPARADRSRVLADLSALEGVFKASYDNQS